MEYLDILDEEGNELGIKKSRKEIHEKGYWHRVVHIWILNSKGELLIQKRAAQKETDPNLWAISCEGHVSSGDTSLEGALKELNEELGLAFEKKDLQLIFNYKRSSVSNNGTYFGNHFVATYLIERDVELNSIRLQEQEVAAVKWIKFLELEAKILNKDTEFKSSYGYPIAFEYFHKKLNC